MIENKNHESKSIDEYHRKNDWPKWKDAVQFELDSLAKRKIFGPAVQTFEGIKLVGYKWIFVRKNEKNKIVRYKARLVVQKFSERSRFDYDETYLPVVDAITFRYFVNFVVYKN